MQIHRRILLAWILLVGVVMSLQAPSGVAARISSCRTDPLVFLSNGQMVRMTVEVASDPDDVRSITYTLHVPEGVSPTRIVYTGGPLRAKEVVVVTSDLEPGHYTSDTLVIAQDRVAVVANTAIRSWRGSAAGFSGEHLIVHY